MNDTRRKSPWKQLRERGLNRRLHLLFWKPLHPDKGYCRLCGFTSCHGNPNYCADPRLVLMAMMERGDFPDFIWEINGYLRDRITNEKVVDLIYIGYLLDTTGKLALLAIEWLGKQEGGKG